MKLKDLKEQLDRHLERWPEDGDREVVVQTANGGIPHSHMEPVKTCSPGFDWTRPYFIMRTAQPVVVARLLSTPLRDLAVEKLNLLKDIYNKTGFKYIAKAREHEWIDGFVEGVKAHITSVKDEK